MDFLLEIWRHLTVGVTGHDQVETGCRDFCQIRVYIDKACYEQSQQVHCVE